MLAPAGATGPVFLLFPNHFVIRKYNNSVAYALAVGLLADRIAGGGPLVKPWPAETPLSLTDQAVHLLLGRRLSAEGAAAGGEDNPLHLFGSAALHRLENGAVFAIDGQQPYAPPSRQGHDQRAGHHERLLVGHGHRFAGFQGRPGSR